MLRNAKIQLIHVEKGGMDGSGNPLPDTETLGDEFDCFLTALDYRMNARSGAVQGMQVDERFLKAKYQVYLRLKDANFYQFPEKVKITQQGEDIGTFEVLEKYRLDVVRQIKLII